jgi:hypothetical protein
MRGRRVRPSCKRRHMAVAAGHLADHWTLPLYHLGRISCFATVACTSSPLPTGREEFCMQHCRADWEVEISHLTA